MDEYGTEYIPQPPMPRQGQQSPISSMPTEILEIILDPSMIIERIRHDLMGESGPYMVPMQKPKLDDDGNPVFEDVKQNDGTHLKQQVLEPVLDMNGNQLQTTIWRQTGKPFMNAEGVEEMINLLNSYVNRNTIFSQMDEKDIAKKMLILDFNIADLFESKYVDYDIDINRMTIVKDRICDMCDFAMKQSQNKALMDALTKLFSVSEMKDTTNKGFSLGDLSPMKLLGR